MSQPTGARYVNAILPKTDHGARGSRSRRDLAREKANAERLSREINSEIEALILGTKRAG